MPAGQPARPVKYALWMLCALGMIRAEAADSYRLDSANTQVAFEVQRFGIRWVTAHFRDIAGELVLDHGGQESHVEVRVRIASVDCSDPRWDERLRSSEWLDAPRYPWMTYRATDIEVGDGRATANGELTLHGVTQPVILHVTFLNCHAGSPCQFDGRARVRRSDFRLPHGFWTGGDQVDISIRGTVARPAG